MRTQMSDDNFEIPNSFVRNINFLIQNFSTPLTYLPSLSIKIRFQIAVKILERSHALWGKAAER